MCLLETTIDTVLGTFGGKIRFGVSLLSSDTSLHTHVFVLVRQRFPIGFVCRLLGVVARTWPSKAVLSVWHGFRQAEVSVGLRGK